LLDSNKMKINKFNFAIIIGTVIILTALITFILTRRSCGDNVGVDYYKSCSFRARTPDVSQLIGSGQCQQVGPGQLACRGCKYATDNSGLQCKGC